jgi:N-glycosylase/DNA lyase
MNSIEMEWASIPPEILNIPATLASGQCFRWRVLPDGEWRGVIGESVVRLKPDVSGFWWQTYPTPNRFDVIERYFALDIDLVGLYEKWAGVSLDVQLSLQRNPGMRILRQEAGEVFFSFICASNNTIQKIRHSVSELARRYGRPIAELDGQTYYAFPEAVALTSASEEALRKDMWGFRAPRLLGLARHASAQGEDWLNGLRELPYSVAHDELMSLFGIGAKIADCICLFGLQHDQAVPVDTHIRQIGVRLFRPELGPKTLTPSVYNAIGNLFRDNFGPYAGWAQQVLFFDELKPHTAANKTAVPSRLRDKKT